MIKQPFYKLDEDTTKRIIKLYKTCFDLSLGNISFKYFKSNGTETTFSLTECKGFFELVVNDELKPIGSSTRDIYKLITIDDELIYQYSEQD